jgi:acetyl-CoA C-acetyltransferase
MIAENVAEAYGITRQEQDEFALESQIKCEQAISLGHFDTEIEPIIISSTKSIFIFFKTRLYFFVCS